MRPTAGSTPHIFLVCHYFSGSSHCAGKYRPDDELAGYWDAIVGPGKAIDTDRYFVVSADTMSNVSPKDPMVTTVGPATIDPDTGRPYGSTFPSSPFGIRSRPASADRPPGRHPPEMRDRAFDGRDADVEWAPSIPSWWRG